MDRNDWKISANDLEQIEGDLSPIWKISSWCLWNIPRRLLVCGVVDNSGTGLKPFRKS